MPLEIEDLNNSSNKGLLIDLSDDAFRTRGIAAVVGKKRFFGFSEEVRKGRLNFGPHAYGPSRMTMLRSS